MAVAVADPEKPDPGRGRVVLRDVTKRYGDTVAVDQLSLTIDDGELFVLLGPSGCGKSTVLRMIAGLEELSEGTIEIAGRQVADVDAKDRDIAMVFQNYALYPHMTVRRNVEFPLRSRGISGAERETLVSEVAALLDLADLLERKPSQLSGGQRQRVALARAIVRKPVAFLMDEPLSNLDAKLRVQTRAQLAALHLRLATTTIYVTHDQVEAMTMGQRIGVMDHGSLQQVGPPQAVYDRPANLFVAGFLGSPAMNTAPGVVKASKDGSVHVALAAGNVALNAGEAVAARRTGRDEVVVGVRPEDLVLGGGDGPLRATVAVVEDLGHVRHVACQLPDGPLWIARLEARNACPQLGDTVRLVPQRLHLFDPLTQARLDI